MYVTGGIGSAYEGEAFTRDYHLPNDTAYAETCAAIGLIFFANRMLYLERDRKYADAVERALYNCVLAGMQLDGTDSSMSIHWRLYQVFQGKQRPTGMLFR